MEQFKLIPADEMKDKLIEKYHPLSVDMETAAIAHVCYANHIPFLAVRAITDTADENSPVHFENNCSKAVFLLFSCYIPAFKIPCLCLLFSI